MSHDPPPSSAASSNDKSGASRADVNMRPAGYSRTHERTIVSIVGSKLVTLSSDGREHSYNVAADAVITCDGVVRGTDALLPGTAIRLTAKPNSRDTVVKIESFEKRADFHEKR